MVHGKVALQPEGPARDAWGGWNTTAQAPRAPGGGAAREHDVPSQKPCKGTISMATKTKTISSDEFNMLAQSAVGLPVSHVWLGYADALFLELGRLRRQSLRNGRPPALKGTMTIMLDCGWRVERPRSVAFDRFCSKRKIEGGVERLRGKKVKSISLVGRVPEISVELAGQLWVQSFQLSGTCAWCLFLPGRNDSVGVCLTRDRGRTVLEMCYDPPLPVALWNKYLRGQLPSK